MVAADVTLRAPRAIADSIYYGEELPPSVGERNSAAVVTEEKVRAIRQAADAGADLATLARAFGIHVRTARHIVQRTSWRHIP